MNILYLTMSWMENNFLLSALYLVFGSYFTINIKWADITLSLGSDDTVHKFNHPLFQVFMFGLGQMIGFFVYHIFLKEKEKLNHHHVDFTKEQYTVFLFITPALLDFTANTLMHYALLFVYSSTSQMLRGSAILFTSLLSACLLHQSLRGHHWMGIIFVIAGIFLVGFASLTVDETHAPNPLLGCILMIVSQLFVAIQLVVEEHYLQKYNVHPLLMSGWEGIWGCLISSIAITAAYWIPGWTHTHRLEDVIDAAVQISHSTILICTCFGTIVSVCIYRSTGMIITKNMSATTRSVISSLRTLLVWIVALSLKWELFQYLQPTGFMLLMIGILIYFGTISLDIMGCSSARPRQQIDDESTRPLRPSRS
jgi:drug/metabolite transporter (DMT)-like permease